MGKKVVITILVILLVGGIFLYSQNYKDENSAKKVSNKGLAIMVYDDDKQEYIKKNDFPKGKYVLSSESYCENGSELGNYDSVSGTISFIPNKSDNCYYYFDLDVTIITFKISDVVYQAEEGMTLGDWVESKYNTDGFYRRRDEIYTSNGANFICNYTDSALHVIRNNEQLWAGNVHCGGSN